MLLLRCHDAPPRTTLTISEDLLAKAKATQRRTISSVVEEALAKLIENAPDRVGDPYSRRPRPDSHLAALALESAAKMVTLDAGFAESPRCASSIRWPGPCHSSHTA